MWRIAARHVKIWLWNCGGRRTRGEGGREEGREREGGKKGERGRERRDGEEEEGGRERDGEEEEGGRKEGVDSVCVGGGGGG